MSDEQKSFILIEGPIHLSELSPSRLADVSTHSFLNDINVLRKTNEILPKSIEEYQKKVSAEVADRVKRLDAEDAKEMEKWYKRAELLEKRQPVAVNSEIVADIVQQSFMTGLYSNRMLMFIREMSLVYLCVSFEDFIGRILANALKTRPECLKSQKKSVTYQEILGFNDLNEIKERIVSKEVANTIGDGIDGITEYCQNDLGLSFTKDDDWQKVREIMLRRNLVIHNNCYPDDAYKRKIGNVPDERLNITSEYLEASFGLMEKYARIISDSIKEKFLSGDPASLRNHQKG